MENNLSITENKCFILVKEENELVTVPVGKKVCIIRNTNKRVTKFYSKTCNKDNDIKKEICSNNSYEEAKNEWLDPDAESTELYECLEFVIRKMLNVEVEENRVVEVYRNVKSPFSICVKINGKEYTLSSDYIGFSKNWVPREISDCQLSEAMSITRTIGGHMVWPIGVGYPTINQAKGTGKGFYDRIDWTLRILKIYYEYIDIALKNERYASIFSDKLMEEILKNDVSFSVCQILVAFDNSREWLAEFRTFEKFINTFKLNVFCSKNGEKYEVEPIVAWIPIRPNEYSEYMKASQKHIEDRTKKIVELCENSDK